MQAYVINLDRRKDRMEKISIPFEYERFSASDGSKLFPQEGKLSGHIGCWDSHRRLLNQIKYQGHPFAMVLEDDVEFCDEFLVHLAKAMSQLPEDWDMLYLGGFSYDSVPFSENLNHANRVLTTHGYIVRDKFLDTLIETVTNRKFKIDVVFCDALSKGRCFICNPVLAWQAEGHSDIEGKITNNVHLKKHEL